MATRNLRDIMMPRAQQCMGNALAGLMSRWADAAQQTVPVKTSALRGSIRVVPTGPLSCEMHMLGYGRWVEGGHRVWNWNTAQGRLGQHYPLVKRFNKKHPLKTHGVVAPNPFLARAIGAMQAANDIPPPMVEAFRAAARQALRAALDSKGR
jgi:hypothetical protein